MEDEQKPISQELVIGTYHGFSEIAMPEIIQQFNLLYPDVQLQVLSGTEYVDFIQNELDVVIGAPIHNRGDLTNSYMDAFPHYLYASSGYAKKFGLPKTLKELPNHRLLICKDTPYIPDVFKNITPYIEATSFGFLYEMMKKDIGIAVLPKSRLHKLDLSGNLVLPVLNDTKCFDGFTSFITRRFSQKASLTEDLLKIVKSVLTNISG